MRQLFNLYERTSDGDCPECGNSDISYVVKLISTGRPLPYPKFIPQIKRECGNCRHFFKFEAQTPELMEYLTNELEEIKL